MKQSRTKLAMKNVSVTGLVTLLNFPIQFINRFFMVRYLGMAYLGITSLYANILSVLSLTDLGVGTAIIFMMYQPLEDGDHRKLSILMRYYRLVYHAISLIIFVIGLLIIPFLHVFLGKQISYPHVYLLFIIYLLGSVSSYLFSYNQSLLNADQRSHIVSAINLIVCYVLLTAQIVTVILYKNPLLYATLFVFTGFVSNLIVSVYVHRHYPYIYGTKERLSKADNKLLFDNVVGNFFLRVSGVVVTGTDNLFLSAFAGVIQVGFYANYVTLTSFLQKFILQVIASFTGSIGNFSVTSDRQAGEDLFHKLQYINFVILNLATMGILFLSKDIIAAWLGKQYILDTLTTLLIGLSFYIMNYRALGWNFVAVYGLGKYMKMFCVNEMIANVVASLIFLWGFHMGLRGVILGTIISTILTVSWQDPYIIFKYGFHTRPTKYFTRYVRNLAIMGIEYGLLTIFKMAIKTHFSVGIIHFILLLIGVCVVVPICSWAGYLRTAELSYSFGLVKRLLRRAI
ncbi:lipopolysaccharide biosynthesis protein [Limosilactobacillus fermentum]|uniref:lipopolysaccharide biosynthesis protein n=1 Tax=Limosilactobacillus fermentum TaxID=1613 RepID=UPI00210F45E1|nr:oligosaccharide flippase family protein [Limosilactobacillus fermentum]UUC15471.1 oligosaccharide flippase family protein [Limosilactobacillus fermentum]